MTNVNGPIGIPDDCQKKIRDLVAYWVSIHPADGLPGRQHFDPIAIPRLLANVRLLDVVGDPPRFFTRVMGTRLRDFYGKEHTGHWYDEMFPHFVESQTHRDLVKTVETGRPIWRRGKPNLNYEKEFLVLERVFLPLASDGANTDMVLTLVLFGDETGMFS
jgi:hypothetical protein